MNVVGEPYYKAVEILKSQGVKAASAARSAACCRRPSAWSTSQKMTE